MIIIKPIVLLFVLIDWALGLDSNSCHVWTWLVPPSHGYRHWQDILSDPRFDILNQSFRSESERTRKAAFLNRRFQVQWFFLRSDVIVQLHSCSGSRFAFVVLVPVYLNPATARTVLYYFIYSMHRSSVLCEQKWFMLHWIRSVLSLLLRSSLHNVIIILQLQLYYCSANSVAYIEMLLRFCSMKMKKFSNFSFFLQLLEQAIVIEEQLRKSASENAAADAAAAAAEQMSVDERLAWIFYYSYNLYSTHARW